MKWGKWSSTAASNSTAPPDGWPEGQAPSTVNDCAREMMASIKTGITEAAQGFYDLDFSPTQTGNTTFTMAGDQTAYFGIGRRVKAYDATNLYGTVISVSSTTNTGVTLRLDSGLLTSSLSAVGVGASPQNSGLPETLYYQDNFAINGHMDLWTRGAGPLLFSVGAVSNLMTADMWTMTGLLNTASYAVSVTRLERSANAANVPTFAQAGYLIQNALGLSLSGTVAVLSATDQFTVRQNIEGRHWLIHAHKPCVAQFWVNSNRTGIYCLALRNTNGSQSCVKEFQISAASTWEHKTLAFPEAPTSGTWDYSTGVGIAVTFAMACGSTLQGGADNWTATNIVATSNQINWLSSTGALFKVTAFDLKEGTGATPVISRPTDIEANNISRYVQRFSTARWGGHAVGAGTGIFAIPTTSLMRNASLTVSFAGGVGAFILETAALAALSVSAFTQIIIQPHQVVVTGATVGGAGFVTGDGCELITSSGGALVIKSVL